VLIGSSFLWPYSQPPPSAEPKRLWTTAEFDRLVSLGVLEEGGPEYLWEGEILKAMPENPPHVNAVSTLYRRLVTRLPEDEWTVNTNGPVELDDGTKPQPDLSVMTGPQSVFATRSATPADVALLVEVADSTYPRDSGERLRKCAAVGIPRYWIVNINARRVEVYQGPDAVGVYRHRSDFGLGDVIPLRLSRGGQEIEAEGIAVADILRNSLKPAEEGPDR
jgi:Uma2 family endonuclease